MYNDRQSRFSRAFLSETTSTSILCQPCGRTHFATAHGHGDYEEEELEDLRKLAETDSKVVENTQYDHIEWAMINGRQVVIDCECGYALRIATFIEDYFAETAKYIKFYLDDRRINREREESVDVAAKEA